MRSNLDCGLRITVSFGADVSTQQSLGRNRGHRFLMCESRVDGSCPYVFPDLKISHAFVERGLTLVSGIIKLKLEF